MLTATYLSHHFLIAMPHMADPLFSQSLVYLVEHNESGAMGLVVNRPSGLNLADILEQLRPDGEMPAHCLEQMVYSGGPLSKERGFVLHTPDHEYQATLPLGELALTTSQDVLFAIADGQGPKDSLVVLGYAGWGEGQLDMELTRNDWLTCPADPDILFHYDAEDRLAVAAARLGVRMEQLSSSAGHA